MTPEAAYSLDGGEAKCEGARPPEDPKLCNEFTSRKDCRDGLKHQDCAWCAADAFEACMTPEAAYSLDGGEAKCEGARPPEGATCSELRNKKDCLGKDRKKGEVEMLDRDSHHEDHHEGHHEDHHDGHHGERVLTAAAGWAS